MAADAPSALVVTGGPRIGKTTPWSVCVERARARSRHCAERGVEDDVMFATHYYLGMVETWRGNFASAALNADDAMERAPQLGVTYRWPPHGRRAPR